jgi:hypothetical protein
MGQLVPLQRGFDEMAHGGAEQVDPQLERRLVSTLEPILVSKFAFECNVHRYSTAATRCTRTGTTGIGTYTRRRPRLPRRLRSKNKMYA